MKLKHFLLLIHLACLFSCKKVGLCKDKELTLRKADLLTSNLKTTGYYFGNPSIDYKGIVRYETLVLYNNGVIMMPGVAELDKLDSYLAGIRNAGDMMRRTKFIWGVANIENSIIKVEYWEASQCGMPAILKTGEVINDSTFVLTKMVTRSEDGNKQEEIHQTFEFRKYGPKPDSTNSFVN